MTRENAIKTLKELRRETNDSWYEEVYNMAISALEADRCETCRHWWKSEEVCLLDDCQYEPKTEPQIETPCNTCANKGDHNGECSNCIVDSKPIRWKTPSHYKPKDEPMKSEDYCDICKRDMCEVCVADTTDPYCVPSHYEINYEPKTESQTEKKFPRRTEKLIQIVWVDEDLNALGKTES